jgi:hypothetical protein
MNEFALVDTRHASLIRTGKFVDSTHHAFPAIRGTPWLLIQLDTEEENTGRWGRVMHLHQVKCRFIRDENYHQGKFRELENLPILERIQVLSNLRFDFPVTIYRTTDSHLTINREWNSAQAEWMRGQTVELEQATN